MRIKSPIRLIVAILTLVVVIWMCVNFVIALKTGEKFSFFGNGSAKNDSVKNFVVAGVDADGYRTDLILLCQVNRGDNRVSVLQIPRDTRVENRRNDKKINSAYYSGFDVMSAEIEKITGIHPDDYAMVSFEGFCDIVNALGGVKVDVPMNMKYDDPVQDLHIDLKKGVQKLDGEEAEMFMRFRKGNDGSGYPEGDVGRLEAQKQLYSAAMKKMISPMGILRSPVVFMAIKSNTDTSFSAGEIIGIMKDVLIIGKENINILSLPGEGKYIGGVSYFSHYKNQTKELMEENFVMD